MPGYSSVRALERGLLVLSCLAAEGASTPRRIAEEISVDRATVYRLLQTLLNMGFVQPGSGGRYLLSARVLDLAKGFHVQDVLLTELKPILHDLHREVLWPVTYSSWQDTMMVVEESTSPISPYANHTFRPGAVLSLTRTTVGRAVLAAMPFAKRRALVARLDEDDRPPTTAAYASSRLELILQDVERRGYGYSIGELDPKMSGIALALIHNGMPIGAFSIIFFTSSFSIEDAAERYLPAMRRTVDRLENILGSLEGR